MRRTPRRSRSSSTTRAAWRDAEDADDLADQVADLWVDFASDGEPDGWPLAETGQVLSFTLDGPVAGPDPWAGQLDVVEAGNLSEIAATDQSAR